MSTKQRKAMAQFPHTEQTALGRVRDNDAHLTELQICVGGGAEGAKLWATALKLNTHLKTLHLLTADLGAGGLVTLGSAIAAHPRLSSVMLSAHCLRTDRKGLLLQSLPTMASLTTLTVSQNALGVEGAQRVADVLAASPSLHTLNLHSTAITAEGAARLASALAANTTLVALRVTHDTLGPEGTACLARAVAANKTLRILNVGYTDGGPAGAAHLAAALMHGQMALEDLDVVGNVCGVVGGAHWGAMLANNWTLRRLCVSGNGLGDAGVAALSAGLNHNCVLHTLDLSGNNIGEKGALALGGNLPRTNIALANVILAYNAMGSASVWVELAVARNAVLHGHVAPRVGAIIIAGLRVRPWVRLPPEVWYFFVSEYADAMLVMMHLTPTWQFYT